METACRLLRKQFEEQVGRKEVELRTSMNKERVVYQLEQLRKGIANLKRCEIHHFTKESSMLLSEALIWGAEGGLFDED